MTVDNVDNEHQYILKIVLLGDPAVGKTSLITQFVDHSFEADYKSTLGVSIIAKELIVKNVDGKVKLIIWDIAGQEKYDLSRKFFFQGCTGALLVYDITRESSFNSIENKWLKDFKKFGKEESTHILIGNKNDLKELRSINKTDGKKLAKKIKAINFIETSARFGENVEQAFQNLIKEVLLNY
jgi:Ras-related protein Rab-11A